MQHGRGTVEVPSGGSTSMWGMSDQLRAMGVPGTTYRTFEREMEKALAGIAPERIVSISYSTSRIFALWLQHHALIVIRE
jgi:hypothetical protein